MVRALELAPLGPFHDIEGTVRKIRAAHPGFDQHQVNQTVKRMLVGYKPRHRGRIVHLYGADIMTANLDQIPAWPWIGAGEKIRLMDHPIDKGEVIPNDVEGPVRRMLQEELAGRLDRRAVNRSVLISPPGLRQTYVWRESNGWTQELLDADYDLILSAPSNRRLFRDPEVHGPYADVRSYDGPGVVTARAETTSLREAEYLMRQAQRQPNWQGNDLPN